MGKPVEAKRSSITETAKRRMDIETLPRETHGNMQLDLTPNVLLRALIIETRAKMLCDTQTKKCVDPTCGLCESDPALDLPVPQGCTKSNQTSTIAIDNASRQQLEMPAETGTLYQDPAAVLLS